MRTGVVALAFVVAAGCAHAPQARRSVVDGGSKVVVEGSATGLDFRCNVAVPTLLVQGGGVDAAPELEQILNAVQQMTLDIPAERLDCDDTTKTRHSLTGLQGGDEKAIRFALTRYEMGAATGTTVPMRLVGEVTFAGKTRPVTVDAQATRTDGGDVRVQATYPLKMGEWGTESSRLRLGTLAVSDDLLLRFDLALKPE